MIENRNVNIITDADGKKLVLINDIRFALPVYEEKCTRQIQITPAGYPPRTAPRSPSSHSDRLIFQI